MAGKKILMLTGEFTEEYEIFDSNKRSRPWVIPLMLCALTNEQGKQLRRRCMILKGIRPTPKNRAITLKSTRPSKRFSVCG